MVKNSYLAVLFRRSATIAL